MQRLIIPAVAMLAALALVTGALGGCGPSPAVGVQRPTQATTIHYMATLRPLNASSVSGTVRLDLTGSSFTVTIQARGLEPNKEHYQHIHGNQGGTVACPTKADADASGHITVDQGLAVVGPIALDLFPYPGVSGPGSVDWSHTYMLSATELSDLAPLTGHVVVLHGMTYHGIYDRAQFVACGAIQAL
jgi:hypothetical protein